MDDAGHNARRRAMDEPAEPSRISGFRRFRVSATRRLDELGDPSWGLTDHIGDLTPRHAGPEDGADRRHRRLRVDFGGERGCCANSYRASVRLRWTGVRLGFHSW